MSQEVRAFVAIDLPEPVKEAIGEVVDQLRRVDLRGVRPVNLNGVHLTVKFLGDVSTDNVPKVAEAVSEAVHDAEAFVIEMGGVGVFPNRRSPRTIWAGFEGDVDRLAHLQRRVDNAVAELGFPKERRSFTPHLTLARVRDGAASDTRRSAAEIAERHWKGSGLIVSVNSVGLIRSILSPKGARYEHLANLPLGEARRH